MAQFAALRRCCAPLSRRMPSCIVEKGKVGLYFLSSFSSSPASPWQPVGSSVRPWLAYQAHVVCSAMSAQGEIPTTMTYTEQTLTCRDCGTPFAWTAGEQEFYASRGLMNAPGRCPECRSARKASGGYGGGRRDSYADRGPRTMYEARCDSCGGVARVPFVPSGNKPVYCSDCFGR